MDRREELENKLAEFEIEKEDRLANRGGSKRTEDPEEEEDLEGQGQSKSPWDQPKPKKGTYPSVGPMGPGDLNVEGDWEGPIELFEFEYEDEGWVNCTTRYYWHPVLGGGIYQHEGEWYRNWEFDYEPPEEEIVQEEPEDIEKEDPKVPQNPSKEGTSEKQTQHVEENPPTTPRQTSARQSKPPQPKPPRPPRHSKPQTVPDLSISTRTRSQQRTIDQNYNPLTPLTPEESKTRENNNAHMKHLREAMKNGIEKWNVAIQKEKDWAEKAWMEPEQEWLGCWLEDLEMESKATDMSPVFIPSVREEWVRAVQLKPSTPLEDPENLPKQPNKPTGPKPARKHVVKKSGAG